MRRLPFLFCAAAGAIHGAAAPAPVSLTGAIDFHCHSGPDTAPRSINNFEAVRQARAAGMRGLVLKSHFLPTAHVAQLAMEEEPGLEVFGGIVLNLSVGGINPEAVRRMAQVNGRRGRVVWLPTFDAESQVKVFRENRAFVPVVENGRPVAALMEVFKIAAEHQLVIATGHSSAEESLILLAAAREAGVKHLVVTHVIAPRVSATIAQMERMAALGAVMECIWYIHLQRAAPGAGGPPPAAPLPIADTVLAMRTVGIRHFLISSDMGQAGNPVHTEGLRDFVKSLRGEGLTQEEIKTMLCDNPARLLGLTP